MQPPSPFDSPVRIRQQSPAPAWFVATLAGCALAVTSYILGAAWVADMSLGLPLGVWAVMTVAGVAGYVEHRNNRLTSDLQPRDDSKNSEQDQPERVKHPHTQHGGNVHARNDRSTTRQTLVAARVPELSLVRDLPDCSVGGPTSIAKTEDSHNSAPPPPEQISLSSVRPPRKQLDITWPEDILGLSRVYLARGVATVATSLRLLPQRRTMNWLDRSPGATRKLRIGLSGADRASVFGDARSPDTEIVTTTLDDPHELLELHDLDAVVLVSGDSIKVSTREHDGREAAWFDWGATRPVSYFSLFPLRLDPGHVSFGSGQGTTNDPAMTFWIARAAAVNARHRDRLVLRDRLTGRTTTTAENARGGDDLSAVMLDLARDVAVSNSSSSQSRIAARAASAFLATASTGILAAERIALMEQVARLAPNEPEVLLRLAAVRFAMLDDGRGMEALLQAERILRVSPTLQPTGVIPLIEAELEHGAFGEMTVGRVAAGICLAAATTSPDRLSFLREDLFEDMRLSSWLIGRDPEHALLMDAFRQLERQRRADLMGLPEARHESKSEPGTDTASKGRKSRKKKAA